MSENLSREALVAWATLASLRLAIHPQQVLEVFGTPQPLFEKPSPAMLSRLGWKPAQLEKLAEANPQATAEVVSRMLSHGHTLIPFSDPRYPARLKEISSPPAALWVRGDPAALAKPLVAIVGARQATPYGNQVAAHLAQGLVRAGVGVVSGGARGIDASAHRATLQAAGTTVAVLGTGIDRDYPFEHKALFSDIAKTGACVSEFPPGIPPRPQHFPVRNRLISGLSLAVVIVEAGEKSGGLITARFALEQNREVFAVPGSLFNPLSVGPHRLIQQGAQVVTQVEDILEAILPQLGERTWVQGELLAPLEARPRVYGTQRQAKAETGVHPVVPPELEAEALRVWHALGSEGANVDQLAERSELEVTRLMPVLLELELEGFVQQLPGQRFSRIEGHL